MMILLSLVLWGWMWGIGRAMIAVPLLAATNSFCDSFDGLTPSDVLPAASDSLGHGIAVAQAMGTMGVIDFVHRMVIVSIALHRYA